ncbi:ribulose 1,5-bisphosphate carboxylase [Pikeienuella piscinae]|uniref:Ribulose 1,5-bisphosphate carboxylase n=1 Tax=Pikeienuella piscinae TaxID=2748098 RepID=A0A7L5C2C4_9RHOB|nr:ribulose-bisphosphate carboxylase large subunit family protein [Pikeienuella piscinae]QIE56686.1 ribulose 1,5-bisphosphate carboxylase [Pikeienuella piscinae]
MSERFSATYDIETPVGLDHAAAVLVGEQSTGTFVRLAAETDALRDRAAARVEEIIPTGQSGRPSLPCRLKGKTFDRGVVTISWPVTNIGPSLPNLLATIAGNLFELAEFSAMRLVGLDIPESFAAAHPGPAFGAEGTRELLGVSRDAMIGTIIKPSIGLTIDETAGLVDELAAAGIDFIKDDELQSNGPDNPLPERANAVMAVLNRHADMSGRKVMYAFNITDGIDAMARHADMLEKLGATCAMVSLNWIGVSGLQFLRERTSLPIHGHRNGWGLFSRSPDIGIALPVLQKIWRLAGTDHIHVNGISNKFTETDEVVIEAAKSVQAPIAGTRRPALPVISSGQTAWQVGPTINALGNQDFLFCAGGGIMSHPKGPTAGIAALRQAAQAARARRPVSDFSRDHAELAAAIAHFKAP